jgi:hypothetical protein
VSSRGNDGSLRGHRNSALRLYRSSNSPLRCGALAFPGGEDFVGGRGSDGGFCGGEEFAADEPGDGGLRGAFGDADGFGKVLIADGDGGGETLLGIFVLLRFLLLRGEPDVDEEAGGTAVVADEVAEENVGDVGVELVHGYTDE